MAEDSSVDVEFKLPVRLTELLKRLNGDLPTGETAITSTRQLKEFISEWSGLEMDQSVRARVLHALAACKTLRRIYTFDLRDLSANDWETFLTPLKQSAVLEEVLFGYPEDQQECDDTKLSLLGRLWADVLTSVESVTEIEFEVKALTFHNLPLVSLGGLFISLRQSTSITKLKFGNCFQLSDDDFKKLMDLLQVSTQSVSQDLSQTVSQIDGDLNFEPGESGDIVSGYA
ncbi:hypothetical protein R1sor_005418 [Riccia sorocarpa]|uniref:Uncharacterized protein n=1 Tax=Riccia sorocarpa TaxID=122646 RepID=A0ABD3HMZ7_9MARC